MNTALHGESASTTLDRLDPAQAFEKGLPIWHALDLMGALRLGVTISHRGNQRGCSDPNASAIERGQPLLYVGFGRYLLAWVLGLSCKDALKRNLIIGLTDHLPQITRSSGLDSPL